MSIKRVKQTSGEVKWEVRLRMGGRGSKRLRRIFEKRTDAEAFLDSIRVRKHESKSAANGVPDFEETTFRKEAEFWLSHRSQVLSPGSLVAVNTILRGCLEKFGHMAPNRLHPGFLADLQAAELSRGLKAATVNRRLEVISSILNFSVRSRRIPFNPASGLQKLKEVREGISFWEKWEAEAFLAFTSEKYPPGSDKRWVYVVYLLALNTGMRCGELWGLQPRDLVQDGEMIHVQRQFDRVSRTYRPPKSTKSRYVPCNPELRSELEAIIRQRKVALMEPIFFHKVGIPLWHEAFRTKYFERDMKEASVRRIRFHDMRHTAATLILAGKTDIKTVQAICGHQQINTTLLYVHLLGDSIKEVARSWALSPGGGKKDDGGKTGRLRLISTT